MVGQDHAVQRMAAEHIALMIEEMTDSKRIEIRRGGRWIKVRFVHILDRPEKGCVPAIIVPEPGSKGWN